MRVRRFYFFTYLCMDNQNSDSGANTVLLVILLLIVVGFGVWWFTMRTSTATAPQQNPGINVDVKLPTNDNMPPAGTSAE